VIAPLIFLWAAVQPPVAIVGKWDDRPTATVAEGIGSQLAPIKAAAESCGFSRTWVWDDDTSGAQLWVLEAEVQRERIACLRRWKAHARLSQVKWKLLGLTP
jgi:hypothetical protein